jgi:hypothetical protein
MSDADLRYQHLRGDITDPRHGRQRRDGVLLEHIGGRGLANLDPTPGSVGKCVDLVWPDQVAALVTQLTRRAIANRTAIDAQFRDSGVAYQVRVTAHGPDRAICVIRPAAVAGEENVAASTAELPTHSPFWTKDDMCMLERQCLWELAQCGFCTSPLKTRPFPFTHLARRAIPLLVFRVGCHPADLVI